jgi:predicted dehydrogenase
MLWASQVAYGNDNALRLRVYGSEGGLEWAQEAPDQLWLSGESEPRRLIARGGRGTEPAAARVTRLPAGHPEGFLESFAVLYSEVARAIRAVRSGLPVPLDVRFPTAADGALGVRFIEAALCSSRAGAGWVELR